MARRAAQRVAGSSRQPKQADRNRDQRVSRRRTRQVKTRVFEAAVRDRARPRMGGHSLSDTANELLHSI